MGAVMDEYYFSVDLDDNRTLCLAPLSDRWLEMSNADITDPSGYFLFEKKGDGDFARIEIIAQIISDEAVLWMRESFGMA